MSLPHPPRPKGLSPAEAKSRYLKLSETVAKAIRTSRQGLNVLTRLSGWAKGLALQIDRKGEDPSVFAANAGIAAVQVAAAPIGQIPVAGQLLRTALRLAAEKGMGYAREQALLDHLTDPGLPPTLDDQAQWLARYGAEQIDASILKWQHAHDGFEQRMAAGVRNCDDFYALVRDFQYWRYRQDRLLQRVQFMRHFAEELDNEIRKLEPHLKASDKLLEDLSHTLYGSHLWHTSCLRSGHECLFPWTELDASWGLYKEAKAAAIEPRRAGAAIKAPPPPQGHPAPAAPAGAPQPVRRPGPPAR